MKNVFYNVARQDITNGLRDFEISSGQDYFILLKAPANANVKVRLNSNTAPQIPIYEFWQFKSADVEKIYLSADAINGEYIEYGQADGNVEITTNPQIGSIDSLASVDSFGANLLSSLDKIINPYEFSKQDDYYAIATARTSVLNTTLTCDKIHIISIFPIPTYTSHHSIEIFLDGKILTSQGYYYGSGSVFTPVINLELTDVNGKTLQVYIRSNGSYKCGVNIQEFNLKV